MATITLFKNIPWSQGGYHVVRFPNLAAQNSYFDSLESLVKTGVNYDPRPGANLNLEIDLMDAREYNYLSWEDETRGPFYYFIEDYEYLNDYPTTRFYISEDIWQNNHLRMAIQPCTVHRRHMTLWNGSEGILYPSTEGSPSALQIVKSQRLDDKGQLGPNNARWVCLLITNKDISSETHEDGIYYYVTYGVMNDAGDTMASSTQSWVNPFSSSFLKDYTSYGIATDTLVGAYLIPVARQLTVINTYYNFSGGLGLIRANTSGNKVLFQVYGGVGDLFNETITLDVYSPTKNTSTTAAPSSDYDPMMFADNLVKHIITDTTGQPLMEIPSLEAINGVSVKIYAEIKSMNPQLRIEIQTPEGASPSNGLEATIPCIPIDIPQSRWLDYVYQSQAQERQILNNNISSRYVQTAVSGITGAASGFAFGAMYAESFNNSKRSPATAGMAGAGMNILSSIGSLINADIQAGTDRDNFKLNESILRSKSTPPIGGLNPLSLYNNGIQLIVLKADPETVKSTFSQYHYFGNIVDRAMSVSLRTRYYYDYIELRNTTVTGAMTNTAKSYLESLLNRGVTVWHGETWGGNFDYSKNNPEV